MLCLKRALSHWPIHASINDMEVMIIKVFLFKISPNEDTVCSGGRLCTWIVEVSIKLLRTVCLTVLLEWTIVEFLIPEHTTYKLNCIMHTINKIIICIINKSNILEQYRQVGMVHTEVKTFYPNFWAALILVINFCNNSKNCYKIHSQDTLIEQSS